MEVRDPVHGSIQIEDSEIPILEHLFFQRLRGIKQLGFSDHAFPGATHTRYLHSIGVMHVGTLAFNKIFPYPHNGETKRLKETLRLSCLLHDIGHAPLSHSTETVMPCLQKLNLPARFLDAKDLFQERQATHEDFTIKAIVDSSFGKSFSQVEKKFGVSRESIAELIIGKTSDPTYFTIGGVNYFPLMHQLCSSELDCDRMDYLLRDSYFCGVSYGKFDLDWIIDNLSACEIDGTAYLGISERAVSTFDDFLLSRFHMFLMVYFHYRAVCLEKMLHHLFQISPDEYRIPADIEEYQKHDDHFLASRLKRSNHPLAKKIVNNSIPSKIFETFGPRYLNKLKNLEQFLKSEEIEYFRCSSKGRLSKYYGDTMIPPKIEDPYSLKVAPVNRTANKEKFLNINEATDLFGRYSDAHEVNRIHVEFELLSSSQQKEINHLIES